MTDHDRDAQPGVPDENGNGTGPGPAAPPTRSGGVRLIKWLAAIVLALVLILAIGVGVLLYALTSERGTRYVWQAATSVMRGQLSGTLDGGAIATGLQLRNVHWQRGGTDIAVDSVSGRWALTREPLRFTIDYLHIGTVDARIAPSPPDNTKTTLPTDLSLPIQLVVRDATLGKLRLHSGATTTEFT